MALNRFSRTELIMGAPALERLSASRVAVFGVGGVGGYVVEALVRGGVGALDLIDNDTVCLTNINRQIIATDETLGRLKVDVAAERIRAINPDCRVTTHTCFYLPETADRFDFTQYDYVVDAVDTITAKLQLITEAFNTQTPIISSMGTANKMDPTAFQVADISKTSVCPLAKIIRKELRKRGIKHTKVVYSTEQALTPLPLPEDTDLPLDPSDIDSRTGRRKITPGSNSFVPPVAGFIIASEVIKDLTDGLRLDQADV
ncbi:tRNA threonylcarbamoyladenosine dehydratase [Slackia heliotrinireducens]|uniref:tRNA threonylcarbamoyladenosine dehydratase n=1 Tax=Slackia heliotrinireducens TaxID=84110 RepID=UPI0033156708